VSKQVERNQLRQPPSTAKHASAIGQLTKAPKQPGGARLDSLFNHSLAATTRGQEAAVAASPNQTRAVKAGARSPQIPPNRAPWRNAAAQARPDARHLRRTNQMTEFSHPNPKVYDT